MIDFSHYKAQDVTGETTREYTFDLLPGRPSLILAPAHDSNEAFLNERLRLATERAERMAREPRPKADGAPISIEQIKANMVEDREYDCRLLATACIKAWGTPPIDAKGKTVPFSAENVLAFLQSIPQTVMVDPFRSYASNVYNWVDRPKADGVALGESQPST